MVPVMRNGTSEALAKKRRRGAEKIEKMVQEENRRRTQINADVFGQCLSPEESLPVLSDLLLIRVHLRSSMVQLSFGVGKTDGKCENQFVTC